MRSRWFHSGFANTSTVKASVMWGLPLKGPLSNYQRLCWKISPSGLSNPSLQLGPRPGPFMEEVHGGTTVACMWLLWPSRCFNCSPIYVRTRRVRRKKDNKSRRRKARRQTTSQSSVLPQGGCISRQEMGICASRVMALQSNCDEHAGLRSHSEQMNKSIEMFYTPLPGVNTLSAQAETHLV